MKGTVHVHGGGGRMSLLINSHMQSKFFSFPFHCFSSLTKQNGIDRLYLLLSFYLLSLNGFSKE